MRFTARRETMASAIGRRSVATFAPSAVCISTKTSPVKLWKSGSAARASSVCVTCWSELFELPMTRMSSAEWALTLASSEQSVGSPSR